MHNNLNFLFICSKAYSFQNFHNAGILKIPIESYFHKYDRGDLWITLRQKDNEKNVSFKLQKTVSVRRLVLDT